MNEIRLAFEKHFTKKFPKDAKELLKRKTNSEYRSTDVRAQFKMFEAGYLARDEELNQQESD